MGNLKLSSGNLTTTYQEVADHLLETHFPGSLPFSSNTDLEPESGPPSNEDWAELVKIVTEDKFKWAAEGFGSFKSAGEDGVFPVLLKIGIEILIRSMSKFFVASIAHGYIPKPLRNVKTIFISKPGRTSYESAKSY
jgi:hypothetical protein